MRDMKTTAAGIAAILAAVFTAVSAYMSGHAPDLTTVASSIMAGIGLIVAADAKK